ncbi:ornithine decarboxylase antizyme-domain-containing protein [Kalaharituber pfeilii]|nr:ornithine decarboxylase antizyme-domain-containing protein [Kalaharituber pfeilii]
MSVATASQVVALCISTSGCAGCVCYFVVESNLGHMGSACTMLRADVCFESNVLRGKKEKWSRGSKGDEEEERMRAIAGQPEMERFWDGRPPGASRFATGAAPPASGPSGVPEVPSGYPKSPPIASGRPIYSSAGLREASRTIAKECERLLCRDMKRIFLGAGGTYSKNVSGLMGSINDQNVMTNSNIHSVAEKGMEFIEVWDYVGEASFRGFIAEKQMGSATEKTLFLFFQELAGLPLKEGLVALIELATDRYYCDRLVICLDRNTHGLHQLIHDLGWVGFELITLTHWINDGRNPRTGKEGTTSISDTSEVWLFVGMDL